MDLGPAWAKKWLDRVKAKTGVTPGIYTSKSVLFSYDWAAVAKTYLLWVAQYPNYEETGFLSEPWTDGWDFGARDSPLIFQYTGTGRIDGEPGDQAGRESWIHDYYSGSWGGISNYNGKADEGVVDGGPGALSGDVALGSKGHPSNSAAGTPVRPRWVRATMRCRPR